MSDFQGVYAAAITPRGKCGEADLGAFLELIDHLCKSGVHGMVLFGPAGEYASFTAEERSRLVYLAAKRSRAPVIVGVGGATLDMAVALAEDARSAGAAAVLVPPPFFFRYEAAEVAEFYMQFAAQLGSGCAILLANPVECLSEIDGDTARELLATGRFAGMVDFRAPIGRVIELRTESARSVLSGIDEQFVAARSQGAGAISAAACAAPEVAMALDRAICRGNRDEVDRLAAQWQEFTTWIARFPAPVAVRTATALRGLKTGPSAAPLSPGKQRELEEFRGWFREWLPAVKRLAANG